MKKAKVIGISILILIILISIFSLNYRTGIFSGIRNIDNRDLAYWNYSEGVALGTNEFEIHGNNNTCWLLIHSYASSPKEYRDFANRLSNEFNETIIAPRLEGHGEVPSHILNLSLDDWYLQMKKEYYKLNQSCNKINLVGSSYGGAIALRLAEDNFEKTNHLILLNPYLSTSKVLGFFNPDIMLKLFGNFMKYNKKARLAQINSDEGIANHFAYWNMPLITAKASMPFLETTEGHLHKVNVSTIIFHSHNDKTADPKKTEIINDYINKNSISSIKWFDKSNHLLLMDYDKEEIINEIIKWEKENR